MRRCHLSLPTACTPCVLLLLLLTACSERQLPTSPIGPDAVPEEDAPEDIGAALPLVLCEVQVRAGTMNCTLPEPPSADEEVAADKIMGGQEIYVSLASSGTSYDSGTEIFQTTVTVQSLVQYLMGTPDGSTVTGVKVFFPSPPIATGGDGTITVANPTGLATFTGPEQPYFLYNQILSPYQMSAGMLWQWNVPGTVTTFSFEVYVSAELSESDQPLLDAVWTGDVDTDWATAGNWSGGELPVAGSTVAVPPAAQLTSGNMPVLGADVELLNLRVGAGSTLDLGGHSLTAWGNLDAVGAVGNGLVRMAGSGTVLGGNTAALRVTGSVRLQRPTRATGAISISDGSLSVTDRPLSISIP